MKTFINKTVVAFIISVLCFAGHAYATTQNVDVGATVAVATITITSPSDLNFGSIIAGSTGNVSTVTIDCSGGSAAVATVTGPALVTGSSSGKVTVESNIDANVTVAYSLTSANTGSDVDKIGISGQSATIYTSMDVANIMAMSSNKDSGNKMTLVAATPRDLHIGGVLTVPGNQAAGYYEGTLVVEITY